MKRSELLYIHEERQFFDCFLYGVHFDPPVMNHKSYEFTESNPECAFQGIHLRLVLAKFIEDRL